MDPFKLTPVQRKKHPVNAECSITLNVYKDKIRAKSVHMQTPPIHLNKVVEDIQSPLNQAAPVIVNSSEPNNGGFNDSFFGNDVESTTLHEILPKHNTYKFIIQRPAVLYTLREAGGWDMVHKGRFDVVSLRDFPIWLIWSIDNDNKPYIKVKIEESRRFVRAGSEIFWNSLKGKEQTRKLVFMRENDAIDFFGQINGYLKHLSSASNRDSQYVHSKNQSPAAASAVASAVATTTEILDDSFLMQTTVDELTAKIVANQSLYPNEIFAVCLNMPAILKKRGSNGQWTGVVEDNFEIAQLHDSQAVIWSKDGDNQIFIRVAIEESRGFTREDSDILWNGQGGKIQARKLEFESDAAANTFFECISFYLRNQRGYQQELRSKFPCEFKANSFMKIDGSKNVENNEQKFSTASSDPNISLQRYSNPHKLVYLLFSDKGRMQIILTEDVLVRPLKDDVNVQMQFFNNQTKTVEDNLVQFKTIQDKDAFLAVLNEAKSDLMSYNENLFKMKDYRQLIMAADCTAKIDKLDTNSQKYTVSLERENDMARVVFRKYASGGTPFNKLISANTEFKITNNIINYTVGLIRGNIKHVVKLAFDQLTEAEQFFSLVNDHILKLNQELRPY